MSLHVEFNPDRVCCYCGNLPADDVRVNTRTPNHLTPADCLDTEPLFQWCHPACWRECHEDEPLYTVPAALKTVAKMTTLPVGRWPTKIWDYFFDIDDTACCRTLHHSELMATIEGPPTWENIRAAFEKQRAARKQQEVVHG